MKMNFLAKFRNLVWSAVFTVIFIAVALFLVFFMPNMTAVAVVLAISSISTAILAGRE
jgi:uncharacterized integral membrane protein